MKRVFPKFVTLAAIVVLVFGFAELSEGQMGGRDRGGNRFEGPIDDFPLTALPRDIAAPPDNPQTPQKVELGRLLFWDPILSGNQRVACATCHHPDFGYAEDLDLSIGVDGAGLGGDRRFVSPDPIPFVKRNSQTILNTAFNGIDLEGGYDPAMAPMFWDVRALGLEAQALLPILTFEEMRGHAYPEEDAVDTVVGRHRSAIRLSDAFAAKPGLYGALYAQRPVPDTR